jgi:hypothetical protein
MARFAWAVSLAILCGLAPVAPANEPLDLIPAESLLCWKGRPFPDTQQPPPQSSALATFIDVGTRIAGNSLDRKARLSLRIFEGIGAMVHYPFSVALIDARAKTTREDHSSSKVDRLRIAAVVKTKAQSQPLRRILQKAINEQTDSGLAQLARKKAERWTYTELRDARLPPWCVIAWGQIDEHFVITLGAEVWPLIASVAAGKTGSISKDDWVAEIRKRRQEEPLIEIMLAAENMRQRLDPFVRGRATAFFEAWRATDSERAFWELGFQERALYCTGTYRQENRTVRRIYADPRFNDERLLQTVPDESRYAIYNIEMPVFLTRLVSSFYATQSNEARQAAARLWKQIQADLGVDAQRDALDHLGNTVVLHNYPPHPLHLPLAFTSLIEIRSEPRKVRATLNKLCTAWQAAIEAAAEQTGVASPVQLDHDDDGIWHLQLGPLAGLAWTFTDRFIVTSYSPKALRQYLDKIGGRIGQRY